MCPRGLAFGTGFDFVILRRGIAQIYKIGAPCLEGYSTRGVSVSLCVPLPLSKPAGTVNIVVVRRATKPRRVCSDYLHQVRKYDSARQRHDAVALHHASFPKDFER